MKIVYIKTPKSCKECPYRVKGKCTLKSCRYPAMKGR